VGNLAPIDYGPAVGPVTTGNSEMQQEVVQRGAEDRAVFGQAGTNIANAAQQITQGVLHTQALKATAQATKATSDTLNFIETNPYIGKDKLQDLMTPADFDTLQKSIPKEYQDSDAIPMHLVGSQLFDSVTRQAREKAADNIGAPRWRENWLLTSEAESQNFKSDRLNRTLGAQMVADQRHQSIAHIDSILDSAVTPKDFELAVSGIETSPWLHPSEKAVLKQKALKQKDYAPAMQAMQRGDVDSMMKLQTELSDPQLAATKFGHLSQEDRVSLQQTLKSHMNAAAAFENTRFALQEKRQKYQDDRTFGNIVQGIAQGSLDPKAALSQLVKLRDPTDATDSMSSGFYSSEKMKEAYTMLEQSAKNKAKGAEVDAPGVYRALMELYADTRDASGERFRQALFDGFKMGDRTIDPAKELTTASYHTLMGKVGELASTDRARVEREAEAARQMRMNAVAMSEGGVPASDLSNPLLKVKYDYLFTKMADAVKQTSQAKGRPLTPDEETIAMGKAAKVFKDNAGTSYFGMVNNDPGKDGLNIVTRRGQVAVTPLDYSLMQQGAKEVAGENGDGIYAQGPLTSEGVQKYFTDFYDNYSDPISTTYKSLTGKNISNEDAFKVYWRTQYMDPKLPAETRSQMVIHEMLKQQAMLQGK
jgi:hypothetical protein